MSTIVSLDKATRRATERKQDARRPTPNRKGGAKNWLLWVKMVPLGYNLVWYVAPAANTDHLPERLTWWLYYCGFRSVRHKSQLHVVKITDRTAGFLAHRLPMITIHDALTQHFTEISARPKLRYFPLKRRPKLWILPPHVDCRIYNVINFIYRTVVVSLLHWASTFVYNPIGVTRQLRLKSFIYRVETAVDF